MTQSKMVQPKYFGKKSQSVAPHSTKNVTGVDFYDAKTKSEHVTRRPKKYVKSLA